MTTRPDAHHYSGGGGSQRYLAARHKANPVSQRLAAVPGVGPLTALTVAATVDACRFESGRHFAAWLGLTPRERSTGGRQRLGGISRAGNERLRQLLVVGAMAVIRHARPTSKAASPWLLGCWSAGRASWRPWLWPTRWPASCGP